MITRTFIAFTCAFFLLSCHAKMYRNEMERDMNQLKTSNKRIDERFGSKYEILSDKIAEIAEDVSEIQKKQRQNRADTDVMMEDLRVEVQNMRGTIEETEHKLSLLEKQSLKSATDLDTRVVELENKFDIILTHLAKLQKILQGEKTEVNTNDIAEYDKIMKIITRDKNFDSGAKRMREFISKYPSSTLADNAQYWMAECFYAKGKYQKAIEEFETLLKKYPKSGKKCGAILKKGFSLANLKRESESKAVLKEVINKCPETTEANTAIEKLKTPVKKDRIAPAKISG